MNGKRVGERVKAARKEYGLTQAQLAEMIDISTTYMSKIERGVKMPRLDTFVLIANILGTTADCLLVDVLENGYKIQLSILTERVEQASPKKRKHILYLVEAMLNEEDY